MQVLTLTAAAVIWMRSKERALSPDGHMIMCARARAHVCVCVCVCVLHSS